MAAGLVACHHVPEAVKDEVSLPPVSACACFAQICVELHAVQDLLDSVWYFYIFCSRNTQERANSAWLDRRMAGSRSWLRESAICWWMGLRNVAWARLVVTLACKMTVTFFAVLMLSAIPAVPVSNVDFDRLVAIAGRIYRRAILHAQLSVRRISWKPGGDNL